MELLEPQKIHAKKLLDSIYLNGVAVDRSDTGTGKTYVAIWIAKQMNCPVVVICPLQIMYTWENLLSQAGVTNVTLINYEILVRGNTQYLNYDLNLFHSNNDWWTSIGLNIHFRQDSLIIIDEIHKARGQKSLVGDMVTALKNYKYKILGMTATLATSVADMKHTGYMLNLHKGHDFRSWCFDHGARYNDYGTIIMDGDQSLAREGMKKIHTNLEHVQCISSRMKRADFKDLFPNNRFVTDVFDLGANNDKLQTVYDNMQYELDMLDERASYYKDHVFAIIIKYRRQAELLKVPAMVNWIEDTFNEDISPVLFVNFVDTINAVQSRLNTKKYKNLVGCIYGEKTKDEKNNDIDLFQADKKRIMLVNTAIGIGFGLHDINGNYPRHALHNPTWSAINFIQATGRIHRVKGQSPCVQRFFYAKIPIEIRMAGRMKNRTANLEFLNEGDISDKDLVYEIDI
jgi:superfamily II DNA or RNA helicase